MTLFLSPVVTLLEPVVRYIIAPYCQQAGLAPSAVQGLRTRTGLGKIRTFLEEITVQSSQLQTSVVESPTLALEIAKSLTINVSHV